MVELKNHTEKLTGDISNNFWLKKFVSYQKKEVKTLIKSNDKYGYNIPNYLQKSFKVVCYLTMQYLSEIFNKKLNKPFGNYLFANEIIDNLKIYDFEDDNITDQIIKNKEIEKKEIEDKLKKLTDGNTKVVLYNKLKDIKK